MDTSGPALVPEWLNRLKSRSNHQDPSQVQILPRTRSVAREKKSGPSLIDQDAPRKPARSSSGTKNDCSNSNRGVFVDQGTCYGFNPKSSLSRYGELKPHRGLKLCDSERICELEQQNVRVRSELNGYDRDREVNRDDRGRCPRQCNTYYQGSNLGSASRFKANLNLKNGPMDSGEELAILPMLPYASRSVSSGQKADFERSFPSLVSEKKHGNSNSNQGNIWQEKIGRHRPLLGLTGPGGLDNGTTRSGISGFGADGRVSALADVSKLAMLENNDFSSSSQIISPVRSIPSMVPHAASMGGLNMAETLVQNIPQDCTSPKVIFETQKLEELALKQSRQLIPVIRSRTKIMGRCSSKRRQHVASSNQTTPVQAPRRPEYAEQVQGRNPIKDKAGSTLTVAVSKGSKSHIEVNGFAIDGKKLLLQEKYVFFDALRKRDTQNLLPVTGNKESSSSTGNKVNELDGKSLFGVKTLTEVKRNNFFDSSLDKSGKVVSGVEIDINEIKNTGKGINPEKCISDVRNMDEPVCSDPMNCISFMGSSEEEEAAFMRSLGWDEHAKVELLTEKEINTFYEQNLEALKVFFGGKQRLHFPEMHFATVARTTPTFPFDVDTDSDTDTDTDEDSYM